MHSTDFKLLSRMSEKSVNNCDVFKVHKLLGASILITGSARHENPATLLVPVQGAVTSSIDILMNLVKRYYVWRGIS